MSRATDGEGREGEEGEEWEEVEEEEVRGRGDSLRSSVSGEALCALAAAAAGSS